MLGGTSFRTVVSAPSKVSWGLFFSTWPIITMLARVGTPASLAIWVAGMQRTSTSVRDTFSEIKVEST